MGPVVAPGGDRYGAGMAATTSYELAQVNIALPHAPLTEPLLADFVAGLDPINALAEASPGFVWRLKTEDGDATAVRGFGDDRLIINMSVWTSVEALAGFVYGGEHAGYMRRRREWFAHIREAVTCCWWVPAGHRPDIAEAEDRLAALREHGPTPYSFTLRRSFAAPDAAGASADAGTAEVRDDWSCPV